MKIFTRIAITIVVFYSLGIIAYSCEEVDCSGFFTKYDVTGYTLESRRIDQGYFNGGEIISNDTLQYDSLNLRITANYIAVASQESQPSVLSRAVFSQAVACSPPSLTPLDSIYSVTVTSKDVSQLVSEVDYTNFFDIVTFGEVEGYSNPQKLAEYNLSIKPAIQAIFLLYNKKPDRIFHAGFNVTLKHSDGNIYTVSTKKFYLSPD